jgi:hypothetical protein
MRLKTAVLVVTVLCLAVAGTAQAYRGYGYGPPAVIITPGYPPPPPLPPPPVYYSVPVVNYWYYPAWNIYWDPIAGMYWSLQGRAWVLGGLPPHVHPSRLGRYMVVPAEEGRPWRRMPHPPRY